jgi:hypothetical protein
MNTPLRNQANEKIGWRALIAVSLTLFVSLQALGYVVLYTEGEVMQGLFRFLVWGVAGLTLLGFRSQRMAFWAILLLGGFLLLWQTFQVRKWAILHEEVLGFLRFAETQKTQLGQYPVGLDHYVFKRPWVKSHIASITMSPTNGLRVDYFMNDPGTAYWYESTTGFGYYPD